MNNNGLNRHEFDTFMMDEARTRWIQQRFQSAADSRLTEELRQSGDYPRLVARALAKDDLLKSLGLKNPCLRNAGLTEQQLLSWYFEELAHRPVPDDVGSYARELGFASADAFRRFLLKEYLFRCFESQTNQTIKPTI